MITNLHQINKIWQIIWPLLPFAMKFSKVKLVNSFCVQIIRKQQCLNLYSNFLTVLGFQPLQTKKKLLSTMYLSQKVNFEEKNGHCFLLAWDGSISLIASMPFTAIQHART